MKNAPPKIPLRFFRWFCHPKLLKYIEGDLIELYEERKLKIGKRKADLKFVIDVLLLLRPAIIRPVEDYQQLNKYGMYKSYLKIGWRNLIKSKAYSMTNIFGLAVGIASVFLIVLYINDEIYYDRYHEKADRIQRVVLDKLAKVPPGVAPAFQESYPHLIEHAVRLWPVFAPAKMGHDDKVFVETGVVFSDAHVFSVFTWPLVAGNPAKALTEKNSIVLTQSMAIKYFASQDPLGEMLTFWGKELTVTGVLADIPPNSHLKFDFLVSMATLQDVMGNKLDENWNMSAFYTYVLQRDGAQVEELRRAAQQLFKAHPAEGKLVPVLQPISSIHLYSQLEGEFSPGGNIAYLYVLGTVALFILMLACINFINLSTARAATRTREVGVRKVMGAIKRHLIEQFFGEAMITAVVALIVALVMISIAIPFFNQFAGKTLSLLQIANATMIFGSLAAIIVIGFVAGAYPAFFLSRFHPITILKGGNHPGTYNQFMRKSLIVFQFTISTFFLGAMAVVLLQLNFMQSKDLGFDKEHVLVLDGDRFPQIKTDLQVIADVEHVAGVPQLPAGPLPLSPYKAEGIAGDSTREMVNYGVTSGFIETMDIHLIAGRTFREDSQTDNENFVLNESAIRELGWEPEAAIGKSFSMLVPPMEGGDETWRHGKVIGVIRDFHSDALYKRVTAMVIYPSYDLNFTLVKASNINSAVLSEIQKSWNKINPDAPFNYFLLNDRLKQQYISESKLGTMMSIATALAVIIACLGLLGLVAFSANQRTKEIGIRKVMGASVMQVIALLSNEFIKLVGMAILIALPVTYFVMQEWLANFAYQVELSWLVFLAVGVVTLGIALLTVCLQSHRAATVNPIESLRSE